MTQKLYRYIWTSKNDHRNTFATKEQADEALAHAAERGWDDWCIEEIDIKDATTNPEASLADFHSQPRHKTPSGVAFVQCYDCYGEPMVDVQRREEYHAALDFFDLMDWEKLKELDAMGW